MSNTTHVKKDVIFRDSKLQNLKYVFIFFLKKKNK
jgi:hypothetical protein